LIQRLALCNGALISALTPPTKRSRSALARAVGKKLSSPAADCFGAPSNGDSDPFEALLRPMDGSLNRRLVGDADAESLGGSTKLTIDNANAVVCTVMVTSHARHGARRIRAVVSNVVMRARLAARTG
jgi:hypothetical protein